MCYCKRLEPPATDDAQNKTAFRAEDIDPVPRGPSGGGDGEKQTYR